MATNKEIIEEQMRKMQEINDDAAAAMRELMQVNAANIMTEGERLESSSLKKSNL